MTWAAFLLILDHPYLYNQIQIYWSFITTRHTISLPGYYRILTWHATHIKLFLFQYKEHFAPFILMDHDIPVHVLYLGCRNSSLSLHLYYIEYYYYLYSDCWFCSPIKRENLWKVLIFIMTVLRHLQQFRIHFSIFQIPLPQTEKYQYLEMSNTNDLWDLTT